MKKIALLFVAVLLIVAPLVFSYSDTSEVGLWVEDTQFSDIGILDEYSSFVSGYDEEASDHSYLRVEYDGKPDKYKLEGGYLPLEFIVRDKTGQRFSELWLSSVAESDIVPTILFLAENLEGFNYPVPDPPSKAVKKTASYGQAGYTWEQFELPFNLKYGQTTLYKIKMLIEAARPFKMRIDAIYIGDGSFRPVNAARPIKSERTIQEKVLVWSPPLTTNFSSNLMPEAGQLVNKISLRTAAGVAKPFILAVTGGVDLGDVKLNFYQLPEQGGTQIKLEPFVISYLQKRWKVDSSPMLKINSAEYIAPGDQAKVSQYKTAFFWIKAIVPQRAKSAVYKGEIRLRTQTTLDVILPITIEVFDWNLPAFHDTIIFHRVPHYMLGDSGKIAKDDVWKRYRLEFEDITSHGINTVVTSVPLIKNPPYMVEKSSFEKICDLAKDFGMRRLLLDLTEASASCKKFVPKEYKSEMARSAKEMLSILRTKGIEPIIFAGNSANKETNELNEVIKGLEVSARTALLALSIKGDFSAFDIVIYDQHVFDWQRRTENIALQYQQKPHWGHAHQMMIFSGLYSFFKRPTMVSLGDYALQFGDAFNDFDLQLGDGSYTPGDAMCSFTDQGYNLFNSIRWECFLEGLRDRQYMELLDYKVKPDSSMRPKEVEAFWNSLGVDGKTHREMCEMITPAALEGVRERVIDYLAWYGGKGPITPKKNSRYVAFTIGSKRYESDGKTIDMAAEPLIIAGSTYIPARYLVEPINGTITWDAKTKTVGIEAANRRIFLQVGNKTAQLNGKLVALTNAPVIVSGRTLIPLRTASELLGLDVVWDAKSKKATCTLALPDRYVDY